MHNGIMKIADHYGLSEQMNQTTEECAELIMAINKYRRNPDVSSKENLFEEIADVELMLEQIIYLLTYDEIFCDVHSRVIAIKEKKIKRQLERIKNSVYSKD